MKKIVMLIAIVGVMLIGSLAASPKGDLHIYTVNNKDGKITSKMIEEAFIKGGFKIGLNSDINGGLAKRYKEDNFDIYSTISIYHPMLTLDIMKKYADAGVFLPMGMAIYQRKGEGNLHVAVTTGSTQAKIISADVGSFTALETEVAKVITATLPNAKKTFNEKSLKETRPLLTKYALDLKGEDWEEMKEELEENFEEKFEYEAFVMPSYFDLTEQFGENSPYDFYTTYSICKMEVIRSVAKVKPEAAAFAPCTTMMYKKKGEDKIVMGFTAVYNWLSSAGITDKDSINALMDAQITFEGILKEVTANE